MSRIKIADLQPNASMLKTLTERETIAIVGGSNTNTANKINFIIDVQINFQINNNISFQIAANGNNLNLAELSNIVE